MSERGRRSKNKCTPTHTHRMEERCMTNQRCTSCHLEIGILPGIPRTSRARKGAVRSSIMSMVSSKVDFV